MVTISGDEEVHKLIPVLLLQPVMALQGAIAPPMDWQQGGNDRRIETFVPVLIFVGTLAYMQPSKKRYKEVTMIPHSS